jgi:hypothetical protein
MREKYICVDINGRFYVWAMFGRYIPEDHKEGSCNKHEIEDICERLNS